jgi:alkanesulfonate monooxygenase SsuD/methylene tetrahydromethanopterin reductase-like flavin-dependent oxidoreductase (luciferase family)
LALPGAFPDANFNLQHLVRFARRLEEGRFDAFFMADHLAVLNMPTEALKRSATVTSFDPLTLLPALAMVTERIGLIATASTTYNEPYHVARKFASLDHISGGRAGWNLVTSGNPMEAKNFGRDEHWEHATRYRRAREFFDVVTGLWDSWADDAFVRDVDAGVFFDPARMRVLGHEGEFLKGPRPAQRGAARAGLAGDRAGRRVRRRAADRRGDRRGGFRGRRHARGRAILLRRREAPRRRGRRDPTS